MRLLFVSHSFSPHGKDLANVGGMQRVAAELDDALSRRGDVSYDRLVLRSTWRWVHVRSPFFLLSTWLRLRSRIRRGEVDVVLFSSMVTAALAATLGSVPGRDRVLLAAIVHGLDVTTPFKPYQRFVRRIFGSLDLVLPVSRATGDACLERGLSPERMRPVRNGVDLFRFEAPSHDPELRRASLSGTPRSELRCTPGGLLLVSVGRHVRRKGFEWFVRTVMPKLPEDVRYVIVGEGPETSALRTAVSETGLGDRVRLLGSVSEKDLETLLTGADLFVMPNIPVPGDMEGFGVVILEAGLAGLPTVGARLEGIAEVVTDGGNGILVPSGDADGFVRAILSFHEATGTLVEASRRAREWTIERFGWDAVAAETVLVLEERFRRAPSRDLPSTG